MALKNVPSASTASAKSAAASSANAAPANAGAPDSALAVIATNFLSVLTGFGAQATPAAPTSPAKSKDDTAPAAAMPPVPTGTAGAAALPTALLGAAQIPSTPVATPVAPPPSAPTSSALPLAATAANAIPAALTAPPVTPPATAAVAPPAATPPTPPTLMPASAAPVAQATSPNAPPAAANTPAAPPGAGKAASPPSATPPPNNAASDDADASPATSAPAVAASDAWLLPPGIRLPTLQPAASNPSATASTLMSTATSSDSEEAEPTSDPTEATDSSVASAAPIAKSVAEPLVIAGSSDAANSITQPGPAASASADSTPSASAAAAAAQAAPMHNAAHMQPAIDTRAPTELRSPVGSSAWTEELGTQLTWMSRHGQDSASLRLSPDHLGPVEVRIEVRDGATSVWFGAAHADTRSALEQSLPRLRQLFAESGLLLADAGVARDAPRQNTRPGTPISLGGSVNEQTRSTSKVSPATTHSGLVDTYV